MLSLIICSSNSYLCKPYGNKIKYLIRSKLLQLLIDEKDKKIANLDAASSGEVARLGATLEEMKGELVQLRDKHVLLLP